MVVEIALLLSLRDYCAAIEDMSDVSKKKEITIKWVHLPRMKAFHHIKVLFRDSLEFPLPCPLVQTLGLHADGTDLGLRCRGHRGSLAMRDLQQVLDQLCVSFAYFVLTLYI